MLFNRFSHLSRWVMLILVSLVIASCGSGDGEDSIEETTPIALRDYVLVWSDEFNEGSFPDIEKWRVETGYGEDGWGNDESQLYTDSLDNLRVEDGNLIITARCDSGVCGVRDGSITSARINSKDKFEIKYGKIEARIKTPAGKSTWPAFWMLGSNFPETNWPKTGEIDIMEMHQYFSDNKTTHFTMHWFDEELSPEPGWTFFSEYKVFDEPLTDNFHVFTAEWDEKQVTGKIDGITYFTKTIDPDTMEEFLHSFFLILNVAVDGTLGGPPEAIIYEPQEMLVDWVRVYEKPKPTSVGLISDAEDTETLPYVRIINSVEFGGNSVISDLASTAVTPLEGETVLEVDYTSANSIFSGAAFEFNAADISDYSTLVFSIDTSEFPDFEDLAIELVDSSYGRVSVPLSNYTPTVSGNWATYQIPLSDYVGVNLDDVAMFGFWNPVDDNGDLIAGILYIDDIRFEMVECIPNATVEFDSINYNPAATVALVSISDSCAASSLVTVKINNGSDEIVVGADLDAAGNGEATINLVSPISICTTSDQTATIALSDSLLATYTNTYFDASGTQQSYTATATAGIDLSAPIPTISGDKLYFYATDPDQILSFLPDTDFEYSVFGSGSTLDGAFSDTSFDPVFAVTSGDGYGVQVAQMVTLNLISGFASGTQSINFKAKNANNNLIKVEFGKAGTSTAKEVEVNLLSYSGSTSIGDGWYEVSIPLTEFPDVAEYDYIAYTSVGTTSVFTYLITDIYLEESVGSVDNACAAPAVPPSTPTEDEADVISLFSNAFTDVAIDTWSADYDTADLADVQIDSDDIKRYGNLGFAAIETVTAPIDASGMTNFRMDVWSPDVTDLLIKWVDFGGDGYQGAFADTEGEVTLPLSRGEWVSLDIPLSDLNDAGLTTSLDDLSQLILESIGGTGTIYVDNVYFYTSTGGGGSASQIDLPVTFDDVGVDYTVTDFGGAATTLVADPIDGGNTVASTVKSDTAQLWAGTTLGVDPDGFATAIPFTVTETSMTVRVYSPDAGIPVRLKVEDAADNTITVETEALTTGVNTWETLTFDFSNEVLGTAALNLANTYDKASIFFNFGTDGATAGEKTYLWDDVEFASTGGGDSQIDLPVTFDDAGVDYTVTDFGGAATTLVADPTDGDNTVASTVKSDSAVTWAGSTLGVEPDGFATAIPFTVTETSMTVRVYSPDAGIPVRLKVEDAADNTITVETEALTTGVNTWETLTFDFSNEALGTAALNLTYTYDKASIFFNFGTDGATAGEKTYLWDDVEFVSP